MKLRGRVSHIVYYDATRRKQINFPFCLFSLARLFLLSKGQAYKFLQFFRQHPVSSLESFLQFFLQNCPGNKIPLILARIALNLAIIAMKFRMIANSRYVLLLFQIERFSYIQLFQLEFLAKRVAKLARSNKKQLFQVALLHESLSRQLEGARFSQNFQLEQTKIAILATLATRYFWLIQAILVRYFLLLRATSSQKQLFQVKVARNSHSSQKQRDLARSSQSQRDFVSWVSASYKL